MTIQKLVDEFNYKKMDDCNPDELDSLANQILYEVMNIYSMHCDAFATAHQKISCFEKKKWSIIDCLFPTKKDVRLLDCAFGGGRDLLYAKQKGYDTYGCELNPELYKRFLGHSAAKKIKVFNSDIRNLPFEDDMFDVVRHNASFLHMPVIAPSYTIHRCIEESRRVLKKNGFLYIMTKEGDGFSCVDTHDGLGMRPFQYLDSETIKLLLTQCRMDLIQENHYIRERNGEKISWIEVLAQKN